MQSSKPPLFQKRHYEWTALQFRMRRPHVNPCIWEHAILQVCAAFKRENPSFVSIRFMQACGLTHGQANALLKGEGENNGQA